jgi:predicted protein tyrosine phosphatase
MKIVVSPLRRVAEVVALHQPCALISLLDPATPFPAAAHPVARHLRVEVHDITDPEPGWTHPEQRHMREILDFLEAWSPSTAPLLVHCYAGISRSTATAFTAACLHNPGADEEALALALREASPTATPNRRLVALADAELGRGGRMVRAIEAIGKGEPTAILWEAEPFHLPSRHV